MRAKMMIAMTALLLGACAHSPVMPTAAERQALAPTGKVRLGFLANNAVHATKDPVSGELKGPAIDFGKELARRLGVPFQAVEYRTVAEMVQSVPKNEWDVISIGINPERLKTMDFSAPYSQIEIGYLVGQRSPITTFSEVDKPGVSIAVLEKGDSDVLLTNALKHATLVRTQAIGDSVEMVKSGSVDAMSALKTFLIPASERVPGSRILEGRLTVQEIAIGVPKGREVSARYVRQFVDELKAEGFIKHSIDRAAVRGLMAAP